MLPPLTVGKLATPTVIAAQCMGDCMICVITNFRHSSHQCYMKWWPWLYITFFKSADQLALYVTSTKSSLLRVVDAGRSVENFRKLSGKLLESFRKVCLGNFPLCSSFSLKLSLTVITWKCNMILFTMFCNQCNSFVRIMYTLLEDSLWCVIWVPRVITASRVQ